MGGAQGVRLGFIHGVPKMDGALAGAMKFRLSHCLYGPKNNYIIDVNLFAHHAHAECTNEGVGI
jgi:hypothetical protein